MALGDPYATDAELKARYDSADFSVSDEAALVNALATSTNDVNEYCGRQFNKIDAPPTTRVYGSAASGPRIVSPTLALVDDFYSESGLVIATGDDGSFGTVWSASDYEVRPLGGVKYGVPGWPFWVIKAVGSYAFPVSFRATLQVTALWGWAAVPPDVKEATLILAEDLYKLKEVPFGVAGFGEWGPVRVRNNPAAAAKLVKYRRNAVKVA